MPAMPPIVAAGPVSGKPAPEPELGDALGVSLGLGVASPLAPPWPPSSGDADGVGLADGVSDGLGVSDGDGVSDGEADGVELADGLGEQLGWLPPCAPASATSPALRLMIAAIGSVTAKPTANLDKLLFIKSPFPS